MQLDTSRTDDIHLQASVGGLKLELAIDTTAEGLTWFYAHRFKRVIVQENADDVICEWPTGNASLGQDYRLQVASPEVASLEQCRRVYGDGCVVYLQRWSQEYAIPMRVACWQWAQNKPGYSTLFLPRVLANAVCGTIAERPFDGYLGVRGIGARSLQFSSRLEDHVTFFDALQGEGSHDGHVQNTKQFLFRMRHPCTPPDSGGNGRGRSFIHFGNHWPCALPAPTDDSCIVPKLSEKIYIWPSLDSNGQWDFKDWLLRIVGLAMMIPKVAQPDHESDSLSHWEIVRITLPNRPSHARFSDRGFTVLVDSGTSQSYMPPEVVEEIRTKWLGLPIDANDRSLYCEDPERFKEYDIVFEFLGLDGNEVRFRCSAKDFLCSPYRHDYDGGVYVSIGSRHVSFDDSESPHAILGQNFFWSAFVKYNFQNYLEGGVYSTQPTGSNGPYIQLSPQRIITQEHILLHSQRP
ncbi:hypothetical protein L226DRAFT_394153 [Lentinus tigrinus ALCF2SS1-7]|uniref:Peptidase A1 domain-containing protein n=1 Tax=Lentinus tigrinus ALCF2SS1-6 TaxID=1328759 RepID=A0A5C2SDI2_9APHY|nr:hypothetical protein L227DRAFT_59863 [Lentinus tigrinus ALCF2SS1-6]RPD75990.1 hypothetical protein L226DRAFT_394153 [Lentinus tigrinus ALCF2SS1-7]